MKKMNFLLFGLRNVKHEKLNFLLFGLRNVNGTSKKFNFSCLLSF